jgi:hypothetical protein
MPRSRKSVNNKRWLPIMIDRRSRRMRTYVLKRTIITPVCKVKEDATNPTGLLNNTPDLRLRLKWQAMQKWWRKSKETSGSSMQLAQTKCVPIKCWLHRIKTLSSR